MSVELIITDPPAGKCPVQAEGTIDGKPFYFRSRGGHWSVTVAAKPDGDVFDSDSWRHREEYKGVMACRDDEINDGYKFAAGWAEVDECIEFIKKCAEIYSSHLPEKGKHHA